MSKTIFTATPGKQEVTLERTFDAPLAQLYKASSDPVLIPKWWGPAKYKTVVDKLEPNAGGQWRFVQTDEQGNEFGFHGVYHVHTPELTIGTFEFEGLPEPGHVLLETTRCFEKDGQTTVKVTSVYQSLEDRDGMVAAGMESGSTEGQDRLAALVESK